VPTHLRVAAGVTEGGVLVPPVVRPYLASRRAQGQVARASHRGLANPVSLCSQTVEHVTDMESHGAMAIVAIREPFSIDHRNSDRVWRVTERPDRHRRIDIGINARHPQS